MDRESLKTLISDLSTAQKEELEHLARFLIVIDTAMNQPTQPIMHIILELLEELKSESDSQ
jgi:hypothetical protein